MLNNPAMQNNLGRRKEGKIQLKITRSVSKDRKTRIDILEENQINKANF